MPYTAVDEIGDGTFDTGFTRDSHHVARTVDIGGHDVSSGRAAAPLRCGSPSDALHDLFQSRHIANVADNRLNLIFLRIIERHEVDRTDIRDAF